MIIETKVHTCRKCQSEDLVKNGTNASGSPLYHCKTCGAYGVLEPRDGYTQEEKEIIIKTYQERASMRGIERIYGVCRQTLSAWLEEKADALPPLEETLQPVDSENIPVLEVDELWSFVFRSKDKVWIWIAMNRETREIVAYACGDRSEDTCRILWALACGKKDRQLFLSSIQILSDVIERTGEVTLVTDGERRYGNLLFEICHEVVHSGKRGRPPKVLRRGVKVRLKNKGSQSKSGRKRPKYEAPHSEHPETSQDCPDTKIHANHAEAFNASLRRRNSAYRRKTNTYAKQKTTLQRTLDIYWITHNFIRKQFTTKQVPAVALGILEKGLSWEQVLSIQKLPGTLIMET